MPEQRRRDFLSQIGNVASGAAVLAGTAVGGNISRTTGRLITDPYQGSAPPRRTTSTDGWSLSDTWTGDLTGGIGGFSESVDAAAGIWIFAISATISSTGSGWTGLTDLVLSIGTPGDYHQDHSGLTRTYRLTEPATINLVAATLGGAIASGSVYWSASKIGEVG